MSIHDQQCRMKQLSINNNQSITADATTEYFVTNMSDCSDYPDSIKDLLRPIDLSNFWQIGCKLLEKNAKLPTNAHNSDAGWDLYSTASVIISPKQHKTISTGISLEIPSGFVGLIWPRSGLAVKQGIDVLAGVIDSGYRGEVKVCLYNTSDENVFIESGDRIAQILFQEVPKFKMIEKPELSDTERKECGFGSTGN